MTANINEYYAKMSKANLERNPQTRKLVKIPLVVTHFIAEVLGATGTRSCYYHTCITCGHWLDDEPPICGKFNVLPPPRVIADGCEFYEDFEDIIPF